MAMRESLVIEQYISRLEDRELRRHVQFAHPTTVDKAISLAVEFGAFEGSHNAHFRKPKQHETPATVHAVKEVSYRNSGRSAEEPTLSELAEFVKDIKEALATIAKNQNQRRPNFNNNRQCDIQMQTEHDKRKEKLNLPDSLQPLIEKSYSKLTGSERQSLTEIVSEFRDIFVGPITSSARPISWSMK